MNAPEKISLYESASEILAQASAMIDHKGQGYDNNKERSFKQISEAFNAITGKHITPAEVALIQQILKDVRQWANPHRLHPDSIVDGVSYAALKGEELALQFKK